MNASETLKSVINKYEISEPVPADVRMAMVKSRKENLIKIMKKESRRSLFITAVVTFFFWIKKFGLSISIAKSAAAVSAAFIISAAIITAAGIYTVKNIFQHVSGESLNYENKHDTTTGSDDNLPDVEQPEILSYSMAVSTVEMDDVSAELLSKYRNIIIQELVNIRGTRAAVKIEKLNKFNLSNKILSISIIKLDEQTDSSGNRKTLFRISAKIINSLNSQVLMYTSVHAENEGAIPGALRELAEKLPEKF